MGEDKAIASQPQVDFSIDWAAITDGLDDELEKDMLPFLAFGVPYVQVADYFGIHKSTISKKIERNPAFANAIVEARKIVKWELHRIYLNQKAIIAWDVIDKTLSINPFERDEKEKYVHDAATRRTLFTEKNKMARFVVQQLGLRVQKVEVDHNVPKPIFMGDESAANMVIDAIKKHSSVDGIPVRDIATEYKIAQGKEQVHNVKMELSDEERELDIPYDRKSFDLQGASIDEEDYAQ